MKTSTLKQIEQRNAPSNGFQNAAGFFVGHAIPRVEKSDESTLFALAAGAAVVGGLCALLLGAAAKAVKEARA